MSNIQNTYYDALFFASSTINEKQESFFLRPVELKLLIKLIHYSTKDEIITWSSENIHNHTCIPVGSIDKAIQRLRKSGYISIVNKQLSQTVVSRQITINWVKIEEMDSMYKNWIENKTIQSIQDVVTKNTDVVEKETVEIPKEIIKEEKAASTVNNTEKLVQYIKIKGFGENDEGYLINQVNIGNLESKKDIDEVSEYFFRSSQIINNENEITM